ncbi:hypothetical protein [Thiospirochaeta perfilievii]|nr:hypothetical protein [Thiospirochaeta perfilievii]
METFEILNKKYNKTILMVTHDIKAASYCKKVVLMNDGVTSHELLRRGSTMDFYKDILNLLNRFI